MPASVIEVLYMLLDNASKYAPAGTTIRVAASVADGRFVQVTVTDEGPGVPPELRERVFEKFFRIPGRESRDPRRVGIGLGLPIARRLVEAQGGRIGIETPGVGARHGRRADVAGCGGRRGGRRRCARAGARRPGSDLIVRDVDVRDLTESIAFCDIAQNRDLTPSEIT